MCEHELEPCATLVFDNGFQTRLSKAYLVKHSLYFKAMFSGNFLESQSENQIWLKEISDIGFMGIIDSLIQHRIFQRSEVLLLMLETSQILQFTDIFKKTTALVSNSISSFCAISVFTIVSRLGILELYDKARVLVLKNLHQLLDKNEEAFFKLSEDDLLQLFNDNDLRISDETDVFNLVVEWCSVNNEYDIEFELAVGCVNFISMSTRQLEQSITKTKNIRLQQIMKEYMNPILPPYMDMNRKRIRPMRVMYPLFAIKNEADGYAFIYRWDCNSKKFEKFIKVDPIPLDINDYHVVVNDMEIYILSIENRYVKRKWNQSGWKYNLLSKQWMKLECFVPTKSRYGAVNMLDKTKLLLTKYKNYAASELAEKFILNKGLEIDTLIRGCKYYCYSLTKNIERNNYICLKYYNNVTMILKEPNPMWFYLDQVNPKKSDLVWGCYSIAFKGTIFGAAVHHYYIYCLAYDTQNKIALYRHSPLIRSFQKVKCFKAVYDQASTMFFLLHNTVMIFSDNALEHYCIDFKMYEECKTNTNSSQFHSNIFFSMPDY